MDRLMHLHRGKGPSNHEGIDPWIPLARIALPRFSLHPNE
jgi:hypothetical protein